MKEEKMLHIPESQWSRGRRPQTAKWKIPKADARRESYSKSVQEPGFPFDTQERCLLKLGEEINRLSRYEVECKKKDQIICTLKNDISHLRSDLHQATQAIVGSDKEDIAPNQNDTLNSLENHEKSHFEGCPVGTDCREESGDTDTYPERLASLLLPVHASKLWETRELIQLDTQSSAKKSTNEVESGVLEDDHHIQYQTNSDILDSQENLIKKLQEELENLKKDHGISKGTIVSLQRIVSFQESQLRKTESEKEILQKHLKERVNQVQAMSAKFSSLRDERKHAETMTIIENENCNLREFVQELKVKLAKRNDMIGDLKSQVQRLQMEVVECQTQVKKREDERSVLQSKVEELECSEQHVKVALEHLQSRFGRFRSKIIQAAFNAPGVKVPQTEIPDHEALEAMQKIIAERSDYHQQLKQMGVKVPPLHSSENNKPTSSAPKKNK
uniref:Coiled-coil domain-containing protein 27 n=1 Tax=Leptobrachium leishanense TaxID=445787 RepID=A0A8C5WES0_9ANUR